tara:strand:- start:183 stop:827 length:645 start_codon:yes stop_codon:yes gene_type:complete
MQAAGSLVGEALVPEGTLAQLSPEEQALIEERKAELVALRDRDLAAYNQAIEISKQYMVQAGQVDPTYFAQQEANKAKIVGAQTARRIEEEAALADKNFTQGDKARLGLDTARVAASKFDEGFMTGTNLRTNLVDAANRTMPTASQTVNYSAGLKDLQDVYAGQRKTADDERKNIQKMFAGLNLTSGQTEKEKDEALRIYGQGYQDALNRTSEV